MPTPSFKLRGRPLGEFGALGGEVHFYLDWTPEPAQVEQMFVELAGYYDNVEVPLSAMLEIAREDTKRRFATETDPSGDEWTPLDPDYLESKLAAGYPEQILHREGDLENKAPDGWRLAGPQLYYDTSVLPAYGMYHQSGSGEADNVGIAADHRERVKLRRGGFSDYEGGLHDSMGVGRGKALPARPFIGLSEEAMVAIEEVFAGWVEAPIELFDAPGPLPDFSDPRLFYTHPGGTIQHRLPSGRFGLAVR